MKTPLWTPSPERVAAANLTRFRAFVNERHGSSFEGYDDLYAWSLADRPAFWDAMWDFGEVIASTKGERIAENLDAMPGTKWFPDARLNFAENLLRYRDDRTALVFEGEGQTPRKMTYAELYADVARLAAALKAEGVDVGDRVAGFMPNMPESIVAMLAATSLGAVWSSCSPDFGIKGVLDRFGQIEPKVLFCANGYFYNGKAFDSTERVAGILKQLPSIAKVVVVPYTEAEPVLDHVPGAVHYGTFKGDGPAPELSFEQLPFDHPLYIMYSSGTTGVPKCIVHGAGGTLLQHLKELSLHTDVGRDDVVFYFTTCGWMMWNWLVSNLAMGATVLLFDGSPFHPDPGCLWRMAEQQGMTVFGTSARYIAALEKSGYKPAEAVDLKALKAILSTGSPLSVESFHYVYEHVKSDLCLSSISGGTDIISCFALGNPTGPVYEGELQVRGLGMKVESFDYSGQSVEGEKAELVCTRSFPSMPIYFWADPDGAKYHKAYFGVYPNIWHHGDFVEITDTGGMIIYGRSDATLNPGGVRIGTAEIYRVVEAMDEVQDSLVVGQDWDNDVRVVLFAKLAAGVALDDALVKKIRTTIRANTTPRHVPAKVLPVEDIPYTISGKKVELAVRQVIHGEEVLNKDALGNPTALDLYVDLPDLNS
jgi:acetoacetyl-CoA synthetase